MGQELVVEMSEAAAVLVVFHGRQGGDGGQVLVLNQIEPFKALLQEVDRSCVIVGRNVKLADGIVGSIPSI